MKITSTKTLRALAVSSLLFFTASSFSNAQAENEAVNSNLASSVSNPANEFSLREYAGLYLSFVSEVGRASSSNGLDSPESITNSIDRSANYTKVETIDGVKAFAAITAASSNEFQANINSLIRFIGKEAFINRITNDPNSIKTIGGYEDANQRASRFLTQAFNQINQGTSRITQASYDIQRLSWGNQIMDKQARLDAISLANQSRISHQNIQNIEFSPADSSNISVNDKIMIAAAMVVAGDENNAMHQLQTNEQRSCVTRAYLNLRMCMAATRYPYEHSFCLSRHAYQEFQTCAEQAVK